MRILKVHLVSGEQREYSYDHWDYKTDEGGVTVYRTTTNMPEESSFFPHAQVREVEVVQHER